MEYSNLSIQSPSSSERGSALFFVFVAIALFAALSFVVGDMMRGGDPNQISEERAKLFAGQVLEQGRKLKETVQDLRISNGCDDSEIGFQNTIVSGYTNASSGTACQIFHADGGGGSYIAPLEDWLETNHSSEALYGELYFPANLCVEDVGTGASGCESDSADNEDLVLIVPYIRLSVCEQINESLGLSASPVVETDNGWLATDVKFTGSFADGEILDQAGLRAGCFAGSSSNNPVANSYHFFQILLPR